MGQEATRAELMDRSPRPRCTDLIRLHTASRFPARSSSHHA